MARYAYGGKTMVESCRSIDVLHWNRLGYFRSSRWFSWAWTKRWRRNPAPFRDAEIQKPPLW
jgi:hypothetical protein